MKVTELTKALLEQRREAKKAAREKASDILTSFSNCSTCNNSNGPTRTTVHAEEDQASIS